jgi:hypothetical protein
LQITDNKTAGAKEAAEKGLFSGNIGKRHTSAAKAGADSVAFVPGINPWPTARTSFSAACKAQHHFVALPARLKSCPDTFCSLNGILQEALLFGITLEWIGNS